MEMLEMLKELGKLSPLILFMGIFIYYLYKRKNEVYTELNQVRTEKDELSKELNKEIRDLEKETLKILSDLSDTLDKISENDKVFQNEIKSLKDYVSMKFEILNSNINKNNH